MANQTIIEEMLYANPLLLLAIKDEQVIQQLNELLPYSTAFEIECDKGEKYDVNAFKNIPDIMAVDNDSGEQRYRLPNGLRGIICLYNISLQLKLNSLLNPYSGIHYHVDCTDCYDAIAPIVLNNEEYILRELDTWLEGEGYDEGSRRMGSWFKLNCLKTIEYRMGEMTFEYGRLLKRVLHVNRITKGFKDQVPTALPPVYIQPDVAKLKAYQKQVGNPASRMLYRLQTLKENLNKIKEEKSEELSLDEVRQLVQNRVHNINPNQEL